MMESSLISERTARGLPPQALSSFFLKLSQALKTPIYFVANDGRILFSNQAEGIGGNAADKHWSDLFEFCGSSGDWCSEELILADVRAARSKKNPATQFTVEAFAVPEPSPHLSEAHPSEVMRGYVLVFSPKAGLHQGAHSRSLLIDEVGDVLAVILGSASRIERVVRSQPGLDADAFDQTARIKQYCLRLSDLIRKAFQ